MAHSTTSPATRPRRGIAILKVLLGIVLVGGLLAGALVTLKPDDAAALTSRDSFAAVTRSFVISTRANGELHARKQTEIRSPLKTRSTITEIVEEGAFVSKGDPLIRLATDELEKELLEAERELSTAKNDLTTAKNDLVLQISDNDSTEREALLELELAQLDLKKWEDGDVREMRQELALAVDKANRESDRLSKKFDQSVELLAQQFISQDEYDRDLIAKVEAESNVLTANIRQEVYEKFTYVKDLKTKSSAVTEAEANLERVRSSNATTLETKQADVEYHTSRVERRQTEYDDLKSQVAASTMLAPNAGLVVYASSIDAGNRWNDDEPMAIGREVHPNEMLIVLPDTTEMVGAVKVHETLVSRVRPGLTASLVIDAADGAVFSGTVESIGVLAQTGGWRDPNNREYVVQISIDRSSSTAELKPSMRCEAEIILDRAENVLTIPVAGVFADGDVNFVFVPEAGRYRRIPIAVGRRSDEFAEVLAGIDEGTRILLRRPAPAEVFEGGFDQSVLDELHTRQQAFEDQRTAAAAQARPSRKKPIEEQAEGGAGEPAAPATPAS